MVIKNQSDFVAFRIFQINYFQEFNDCSETYVLAVPSYKTMIDRGTKIFSRVCNGLDSWLFIIRYCNRLVSINWNQVAFFVKA